MKSLGFKTTPRGVGPPRQDRPARRRDGRHDAAPRTARAQDVRRLDRPDRRGRAAAGAAAAQAASSATSWSRCGTGATQTSYMHDEITTSKQNPRVNANGPVWAVDAAHGKWVCVDPQREQPPRASRSRRATIRRRCGRGSRGRMPQAVELLGRGSRARRRGRSAQPDDGQPGPAVGDDDRVADSSRSGARTAKSTSTRRTSRRPTRATGTRRYYDPKTGKFELIYTCFGTHHLQFSEKQDMLYFSGGGADDPLGQRQDLGGDEGRSRPSTGWCPTVLDTNGDGKITKPWNEPVGGGRAQERGRRRRHGSASSIRSSTRASTPAATASSSARRTTRYGAPAPSYPGRIMRLELGRESARKPARRRCTRFRTTRTGRTSVRAASTSIATASPGRRCPAAAGSSASIAASARCSTGRRSSRASSAPKAGRSIR